MLLLLRSGEAAPQNNETCHPHSRVAKVGLNFSSFQTGLDDPLTDGTAVTASDATVLTTTRAIFVGGAGNLSVVMSAAEPR
jgi:hypothetical protein